MTDLGVASQICSDMVDPGNHIDIPQTIISIVGVSRDVCVCVDIVTSNGPGCQMAKTKTKMRCWIS